MINPEYYKECVICARCKDWVDDECDTQFVAILVPKIDEAIADALFVTIPEHWEIWNARHGCNEELDNEIWEVTHWDYIIDD